MPSLTSRERVARVLAGELPDRVPVLMQNFQNTAYLAGMTLHEFCSSGARMAEAQLAAWERFGYDVIDLENGTARAHLLTDKLLFDTQTVQEVCNLMHLRQLGCSTGTLQDFGPDFGVSYILDGLTQMGQKSYAAEDHE